MKAASGDVGLQMMESHHEEHDTLQIRCPSCGQRFKVGEDFRGRTVECGSCEHRFMIDDDAIVRVRKYYPGERRDPRLDGFARTPISRPEAVPSIPQAHYTEIQPKPVAFEPPSASRVLCGILAVAGMILAALLLVFGARRGGMLDGMTTNSRLLIAAFAGVLGGALLIYANPRARWKGILAAIVGLGGLLALPFFYKEGSVPLPDLPVADQPVSPDAVEKEDLEKLAFRIGLDPLVKTVEAQGVNGSGKQVVGVWLRNLKNSNKPQVSDFMIRATGADFASHLYPRDNDEWLMVLISPLSMEEVATVTGRFALNGKAERIIPKLGVVEVKVDNDAFVEGAQDKLTDRANPAFYELNKRELDSIDLGRARRAVGRLAEADPKVYRADIQRRLVQLLKEGKDGDSALHGEIARALTRWETPGDGSVAAVAAAALKLHAAKTQIPRDMIVYLAGHKETSIAPVLDGMWADDCTTWEQLYGDLGPVIEPLVLKRVPTLEKQSMKQSAVRLLGRVGSKASLPALQELRPGADAELKVLIERAETSIRQRDSR